MKIVFFNRFFHPDTSATSQILSDLAFNIASLGTNVHVVTGRIPQAQAAVELIRGVTVHRVTNTIAGAHGVPARALAYVDYYRGARAAARQLLERGDIAVLKTDPPMLSTAVGSLAARHGAKVVIWAQDVFPEVAREYGIPGTTGISGRWLERMRDRSFRRADRIVAISPAMAARIRTIPRLDSGSVHVIPNWADGHVIRPVDPSRNPLRARWGVKDKFVVQYSGNLGRVHEFNTLLDAAKDMADDPTTVFLIVGKGPRLAEVRKRVDREAISNVVFYPPQERGSLADSLGVADVHISVLRPEFEGLVMPSKLYGILAAGRASVFVGDTEGETAALLASTGAGLSSRTGDVAGLAATLRRLRDNDAERHRMATRARNAFDREFSMSAALSRWRDLLASLNQ